MFAGDSSFGEDNIEMMEIMMLSTCTDGAMLCDMSQRKPYLCHYQQLLCSKDARQGLTDWTGDHLSEAVS